MNQKKQGSSKNQKTQDIDALDFLKWRCLETIKKLKEVKRAMEKENPDLIKRKQPRSQRSMLSIVRELKAKNRLN